MGVGKWRAVMVGLASVDSCRYLLLCVERYIISRSLTWCMTISVHWSLIFTLTSIAFTLTSLRQDP
jgi:hypothetical protein